MIITKFQDFKLNEEFIDKIEFRFKKEEIEDFLLLLLDYGFKYEYDEDHDDDDDETAQIPGSPSNSERYITKGIYSNDQFMATTNPSNVDLDTISLAYKVNLFKRIKLDDMSIVMNKLFKDIESNKSKLAKVNLDLFYDFSINDDDDYASRHSFKDKKKHLVLEFVFVDKQPFKDDKIRKILNNKKFDDFFDNYISDKGWDAEVLNATTDEGKIIIVCEDKKTRNQLYTLFWNMDYFIKFKKSDAKKEILNGVTKIKELNPDRYSDYHNDDEAISEVANRYDGYLEFEIESFPIGEENKNGQTVLGDLESKWNDMSDNNDTLFDDIGYDIYDEFYTSSYGRYVILEPTGYSSNSDKITKKHTKALNKCVDECNSNWEANDLNVEIESSTDKMILISVTK